ncbi:TonB-dependent receptor plug domain-containing protein [Aequorivita sp. F47161]|uniref:TonB-dependent receptor plug domain-containing protein n=1 Tax=Aequorivita vitellina TaxID=2874475 RepID=A0A9X1U2U3_9FLAO|nr:alpha-2-macroglobulin family protein [Aequorivita vitellina]MCG2418923.1 TonB-dependent receptor plug domain-containing protein [Aequorivita vitellina]
MKNIILAFFLLFAFPVFGQNFEKNWKKVIQLEETGSIKSALKEVNKIYEKAIRKNNDLEVIKTFFFRSKYLLVLEENAQTKIINNLQEDINTLSEPNKSVLEYLYISCLNSYWQQNKYNLNRRTETETVFKNNFLTWTISDFKREIDTYINKSVANNSRLKNKALKDYELILDFEKLDNLENNSLYEFLLKKYIDIYASHLNRWDDTSSYFKEIENKIFGSSNEFLSISFDSLADGNLKSASLLYQELERQNPENDQLDFERMLFFETYIYKNETDYLKVLNSLQTKIKDTILFQKVQLQRANLYAKMASKNNHPDYNEKAMKILDSILSVTSRSNNYKIAFVKKQSMLAKSVNIQLQKYVYEGENTRAFVNFKNADSLILKLFKVPTHFQFPNNAFDRDSVINNLLKNAKFEKTAAYKLPSKNDLFSYSTEVLMPKLKKGKYLILFAVDEKRFSEKKPHNFTFLNVTDMSILHSDSGNTDYFQVVNRKSGKPIENATIQLDSTFVKTDESGSASILRMKSKRNNNGYAILKISKEIDSLNVDFYKGYYNEYSDDEDDELTGDVKFYMDRAIYRPGQKAYVKAIALQSKNGVKSVVPNLTVYVEVNDANYDTILEREYKTNAFGSFTFDFIIPKNGVTGEYSIEADEPDDLENDELYYDEEEEEHLFWDYVDFDYSETEFSVEDYKRPTFKIEFNPVTETFGVNDTVSVSGKAISFAGVNLNDSKVTYSVERNSYPNYRHGYYSEESLTITQGETTTDSEGNFKIDFTALPYLGFKKEDLPVFHYTIDATVTDSRGETQNTETTIKVGYHALDLEVTLPSIINTKNENTVQLNSTNLNGSFLATKGVLKIYYKTPLETKFKPRVFSEPEIPGFTKEEFEQLFPYEKTSAAEKNDALGTLIFSKEVNTEFDKELSLDFLKTNEIGNYKLVFSAKDAHNNDIETSSNFTLLHENTNQSNKLFTLKQINAHPFKDGFVEVEIRSEIKTLYINVSIPAGISKMIKAVRLKNGISKIKVPINIKSSADVNINFETYFENQFFAETFTVEKEEIGEIDITINSFRNKIEPGSEQNWSFTITNKNKAIEAEVLASMYDSSLDQFKIINWDGLKIRNYYGNYNYSTTHNLSEGLEYANLSALNDPLPLFHFTDSNVDIFWFGFNFTNPKGITNYTNKKKIISKIPAGADMVYGIVTDDTGLPLPGANVIVRGTSRGTQTDFDGYYSLEVAPGEVLDINYVGFDSNSFIVSSGEYNVSLEAGAVLDEVVVMGYSVRKETQSLSYSVVSVDELLLDSIPGVQVTFANGKPGQGSFVRIRGAGSLSSEQNNMLIIIDGVPVNFGDKISGNSIDKNNIITLANLNSDDIANINVLKREGATALYGSRGANGVLIITTKTALDELKKVPTRKNFNETAFFYPHLKTDKNGQISFNFTSPESLTQWKLRLFAHNKTALSGYLENLVITQKELMIAPNMPRFFREKDTIKITARISNLTTENKSGTAILQLFDPITMEPIDTEMGNETNFQNFQISAKGNTTVTWKIHIPEGLQGVQYKVIAKAGDFSDGEENIIPVLTNNILVTESIPLWVKGNTKREYTFENWKNNTSTTLKNHQLTLEYTSNPTWLALQALPYLMEYEHECSEQTFARYYANSIATDIINSNPKIAEYFENLSKEGIASKLEKNEALKSIILAETPWFNDAQTKTEKLARTALLFDLEKMKNAEQTAFEKLSSQQMSSGAFPWFQGGGENEFITRHILAGLGKLMERTDSLPSNFSFMTKRGIAYLDKKFEENQKFNREKLQTSTIPKYSEIHYLYTRSFYLKTLPLSDTLKLKINEDLKLLKENWLNASLYEKGMAALIFQRFEDSNTAKKIINNFKETAANNEDWGMYWIENKQSWYWYKSPIETQALLIKAFAEVANDKKSIEAMKVWLLKNKQVKHWATTKSNTEAIDALLTFGSDWTTIKDKTKFELGDSKALPKKLIEAEKEIETGYFKIDFKGSEMTQEMATLTVNNKSEVPGFGGFYWQYFEDLDKIKTNANQPLKISKELYLKKNTDSGQQLQQITAINPLKIGDLITVRLIVSSAEDMEYVHLKGMRASALEPVDVISKYIYKDGLGYYMSTRDAATHFFFDSIKKGTYVLEYDVRVNNIGEFSNGITTIQSMYAPEFSSHSKGIRIKIEE